MEKKPGNLYNQMILLIESWILGFGIRKTAQGIQDPTNHWNPEPKFHRQIIPSTAIRGMESKSNTVLRVKCIVHRGVR